MRIAVARRSLHSRMPAAPDDDIRWTATSARAPGKHEMTVHGHADENALHRQSAGYNSRLGTRAWATCQKSMASNRGDDGTRLVLALRHLLLDAGQVHLPEDAGFVLAAPGQRQVFFPRKPPVRSGRATTASLHQSAAEDACTKSNNITPVRGNKDRMVGSLQDLQPIFPT
jgi:hypothetical protein